MYYHFYFYICMCDELVFNSLMSLSYSKLNHTKTWNLVLFTESNFNLGSYICLTFFRFPHYNRLLSLYDDKNWTLTLLNGTFFQDIWCSNSKIQTFSIYKSDVLIDTIWWYKVKEHVLSSKFLRIFPSGIYWCHCKFNLVLEDSIIWKL